MDDHKGWKSKKVADYYKKVIDFIIPGRRDILDIIARIATEFKKDNLKVLDIGCGHGDVTAEILKHNGDAAVTLLDYSDEMIKSSKDRFKDNNKVRILQCDLNKGLPVAFSNEHFDVVVSCFAIHHIDYENRVKLYDNINKVLHENSFFINGDMFKGDSPRMHEWEFDNWISWMRIKIKECMGKDKTFAEIKERQLRNFKNNGDMPGTVWEMYRDLKQARFKSVDCMMKIQNLAIIVAEK